MNQMVKFALVLATLVAVSAVPAFAGDTVAAVPEPVSLTLLAAGIGGVAVMRRLRKG